MTRKFLINFPLSTGSYCLFTEYIIKLASERKSAFVCVANVHMFIEAYKDPKFLQIINQADLVTPDGIPLIWGLRILNSVKQSRVAGMDLLPDLLSRMEAQKIAAYFYGSTEIILNSTKTYLKNKFPNLILAGFHSPPFGEIATDDRKIIADINSSTPSIVFVILGCPKQEKWMASMKDKIQTLMIGIGGALPVMLGIQKRAPRWMQKAGLEWLFRLSQEPKRLFRRYITTNTLFLWIILRELITIKILKPLRLLKCL
ncbi:MAG TPA: WecB/TagA/CpsF family glycosyltransferase [Ginsengibacter sp.]|nr:WecB/TagA/CpsF family glycosyltransferase [Ginsengibacter sp.]